VAPTSQPLGYVAGIAHVGANGATKPFAVDRGEANASIGQRFGGGLAAQRDVFQLAWKLTFHLDRGAKQHSVGNTGHAGQSPDGAVAVLDRFPNGFASTADRRDHADAGDDYSIVVR
jgi:hypothetical protein